MLSLSGVSGAYRGLCVCGCAAAVLVLATAACYPGGAKDAIGLLVNGVLPTESSDFDAEMRFLAEEMKLRPGMTLCEVGAGDRCGVETKSGYVRGLVGRPSFSRA